MDQQCPTCGISVSDEVRCPLCDTRLVSLALNFNVRRTLLWALVVEEYVLVVLVMMRLYS
jgi:hypothetical protein